MILPTFPLAKDDKGRKIDGPRGLSEQTYKRTDISGILYQMNYWSPGDHSDALQDVLQDNLLLYGTAKGKDVYCTQDHSIFLVKEDMRIIRIGDKIWPGWDISQEGFEPSACGFTVRRSTN